MCLTYLCCRKLCCGDKKNTHNNSNANTNGNQEPLTEEDKKLAEYKRQELTKPLTEDEVRDYENLMYIAQKREIKVTIQKGTQAGIAAGLLVMGGVIVAGPVGAVVGGAIGTGVAASISQNVVSLSQLLDQTPPEKRGQVYRVFSEAMREEFQQGFTENPELRLLLSGGSVVSVVRYCLDRDMIENEKLEKLDNILKKIK